MLRYINSYPFNFETKNAFEFVRKELGITFELKEEMLNYHSKKRKTLAIDLRTTEEFEELNANFHLRVYRGKIKEKDSIVWEIVIESSKKPELSIKQVKEIMEWLEDAHGLARQCFDNMISERLKGEFA